MKILLLKPNSNIKIDLLFMLSLGLVFFAVTHYNISILVGYNHEIYASLIGVFISITILYIVLPDTLTRIFFFVGLALCLPMISHPVDMLPLNLFESIKSLFVSHDRIQIRFIVLTIVSLCLFLEIFLILFIKKSIYLIYLIGFTGLLVLVVFVHQYKGFSILQVVLDLGQLLACLAIFCYFRMNSEIKLSYERIDFLVQTIFFFLCCILLIDILVSLSGVVSWTATSWRTGYRGLFYAAEGSYAWILGVAFTYLLMRLRYLSFVFFIVLFLGIVYLSFTNIKTAVAALFITSFLYPTLTLRVVNKLALPIILSCLILLVFSLLTAEETNSVAARVGTYVAYFFSWTEGFNWLIGIKPGVTEFSAQSNLANSMFESDFVKNILSINENLTHELLMRANYEEGGAFLPHNSSLALIASYGIILLVPSFYYYVFQPWLVLKKINPYNKLNHSMSGVVIYMALFGFLHPIIILGPLVVFIEVIRAYNLQPRRLNSLNQ